MALALLTFVGASVAMGQGCTHRGLLDPAYCDENGDLVADLPADEDLWANPATIVISLGRISDPEARAAAWRPTLERLEAALGRDVALVEHRNVVAQIAAMRAGEVHIAAFGPQVVPFAVNLGGAVPFAVMANEEGGFGYSLRWYARAGSGIASVDDVRGRLVAHVTAGSYSGNAAPTALLGLLGLTAGVDYETTFTGSHERSLLALAAGEVDVAVVASNVADRLLGRRQVDADALVMVHESGHVPTTAYVLAYDLHPDLATALRQAFFDSSIEGEGMADLYGSAAARFVPVTYAVDWEVVREIQRHEQVEYTPSNL
ncbi:MAG: phosphate/phosphite/phosphonate ABC transporter substrate-binding protein [Trueperaceae bacterium]